MQTLAIAENSNAELKKKPTAEEQARKSADSALEGAERQAESQRKLAREANDQLATSIEQLAALKKQLEEAQKLRDQVEEAKAKAEKERDETEQHGYDVGVVETEDAPEVLAVCRAYSTQTWEEALNRAGIDASSELRKLKNIIFPPALQIPNQKKAAPPVTQPAKEAQPQNPPLSSQQEKDKEPEALKSTSLDKVVEPSQPEAASQSFAKELASTTLPVGGASKEKEKEIPPETTDKAPKSRVQIKLKP